MTAENPVLWTPTAGDSRMARFMAAQGHANYDQLHRWSVAEPAAFWSAVWDEVGLLGHKGDVAFRPHADIRVCDFFPEARLNMAETMLKNADARPALVFIGEDGRREEWSRAQLRDLVSQIAAALRALGVGKGDRVAGFVPNMPQTLAAMLAAASLGAIWSSCSPDFGVAGVEDRFGQIEPKVLFAAAGYFYGGKVIDSRPVLAEIVARLPSVQRVVVWDYAVPASDLTAIHGSMRLDDFIADHPAGNITFEPMRFRDPLYILFSSGTTGKPKCIVHSGGGVLLQHMKEQQLHCGIGAGTRFFYFTTCGWMMWNWLASGLASEATLILFDGNPAWPSVARLADLIDSERIEVFGTSAKFLDSCAKAGLKPRQSHKLSSLRTVLSTGSPLLPETFEYVYRDWKADIHLASISGGTDICGCFIGGVPTLAVRKGEIQAPMLGMDVAVLDDNGARLQGQPGELCCMNSHPSMPVGFWGDSDGSKYHAAYFDVYPNVWRHGDYVTRNASGGYVVAGRSDATLNPGGVRIGTAEIYRQVERVPEVLEALVIGQDWQGDVRVVLFVRLRPGVVLDEALITRLKREIRDNASPRHVPAKVLAVADLPRTKSGKITELAVRDIVHGRPVKNVTALANPEALELFRNLPELQS